MDQFNVVTAPAGMGAVMVDGGCGFRVWAPHAERVQVRLHVEPDTPQHHDLEHEENGYWARFVSGAAPGMRYKFLITRNGETFERIDPYSGEVTHSAGDGVIVDHGAFDWRGDSFELPPHNELVIYEMHIGSFVARPDGPGGFAEALERVGHLKRLGVNAIQIMPIAEFAGNLSWGYNPSHIFAVESTYGGPNGLKTLVRECHKNGIAVILDVVYNHFGPSDLDLWRFDGWSENDGGGIYFYNDHRAETPWGKTRPDYGRGEVRQFIRDNALMWMRDYHMDGLRFDMTLYVRTIGGNGGDDIPEGWSLMQWINMEIRGLGKRHITIAEDLREVGAMTDDAALGGAGFNAQWDANFVHPVRESVIVSADEHRSMDAVREAVAFRYNDDAFRRVIYSESHDEVANGKARVPHEINPGDSKGWFSQKRSSLATGLVLTSPGIPMLFQGQEFLQGEWFRDDVPLDWDLNDSFQGMVRLYRDLIGLRRNLKGLSGGLLGQNVQVAHVNDAANVIAFHRFDRKGARDDVMVVLNFATTAREDYRIGLPAAGLWRLRLNSDAEIYSADFGNHGSADVEATEEGYDGMSASGLVSIAPYSFLIYSQD